jgi:hypothetical protein
MADVYTKMKPDSFRLQVQTVLTAYYDDIKGVQGASGCPKTKVVKCKLEDQEDTRTTQDKDAAADATADAATSATPLHRGTASAASGLEAPQAPALPVSLPPALRARALQASWLQGVVGGMQGPKADAD